MPRRIHFNTFGNTPLYADTLERITREARDSHYFHTVTAYTQDSLPALADHAEFIRANPRGYGYWLWKPFVLAAALRAVPEGDIVVYLDAGSRIHTTPEARALFATYIKTADTHPTHRIGFLQPYLEATWNKADLLERFGVRENPQICNSGQYWGGGHIMMNTSENRAFVDEWMAIATADHYHFLDDSPSVSPNHPSFKEHRHDQSIVSLLFKRHGCAILPSPPMVGEQYPLVPARLRPA